MTTLGLAVLPFGETRAEVPAPLFEIPQSRMTVSASSAYSGYPATKAIDGDESSFWLTTAASPQWLQIDLGFPHTIAAIEVYAGASWIKDYEVYVSNDPGAWGEPVAEGRLPDTTAYHPIVFEATFGRYLRLVEVSRYSTSQIRLYELRMHELRFAVADRQTGSREYTNSNTVDVAVFPVMPGYDRYRITQSDAAPADGWIEYDYTNLPATVDVTFDTPAEGATVTNHAWLKDTSDINPVTNATASIVYIRDSADVTVETIASIAKPTWGSTYPAQIRMREVAVASSSSLGIFKRWLSVAFANGDPATDATPDDLERVTLAAAGDYTLTMTVMDMAGNTASDDTVLTVTAGPTPQVTAWNGSGNGWDWFDNLNWNNNLPGPGALVEVGENADVLLPEATADLAAFTMTNGATLTFTGALARLIATNVTIVSGLVTHTAQSATQAVDDVWAVDARVWIECEELAVGQDGEINVDGKGYRGGNSRSAAESPAGKGPGGGLHTHAGGGHADRGGEYSGARNTGGAAYGLAAAPELPGSGGAGYLNISSRYGGNGGGVVRIVAGGRVTIDGVVSANGTEGIAVGGGGSGGSLFITCGTFDGTGRIHARGGDDTGGLGGGGSGGRLAIVYTNTVGQDALAPSVRFNLNRGSGGTWLGRPQGYKWSGRGLGSFYLPGSEPVSSLMFSGEYYGLIIPGFTHWAVDHFTLTNGWVVFPDGMTFDVAGDLTIGFGGTFSASNMTLSCGNLIVINGGALHVHGGLTNGAAADEYGTRVRVNGLMKVGAGGSAVYPYSHPTNGGSVFFQVDDLRVESGGSINADATGFERGFDPDGPGPLPYSEGRGPGHGKQYYGGAGYGGLGGWNYSSSAVRYRGATYGSSEKPTSCGSGGGGYVGSGNPGGWGGGLVWISADGNVTVDGVVSANGGDGFGGGSGGGIYIVCRKTLAGSGDFFARGGTGNSTLGGGGGGGRIAIWRMRDAWTGDAISDEVATAGGTGFNGAGDKGTVTLGLMPPSGTVIMVR